MQTDIEFLRNQVFRQEKRINRLICLVAGLLLALGSLGFFSFTSNDENKVLRVRGLVVVDDAGRERILIGAPLPEARNRVRTDTARVRQLWAKNFGNADQYMKWYQNYRHSANGILVLDEQGFDKVCLGDGVPDANIGRRVGTQTGLIFCDNQGYERGGLGLLRLKNDKDRAVLALDGENGTDAVGLSVLEDGQTGFFAGGQGHRVFIGSAPAGNFDTSAFFGFSVSRQQGKVLHQNFVGATALKK